MTRRERIERRAEKRREWAESRSRKAEQRERAAKAISDNIPLGQPILVGHHSEKRHRKELARIQGGFEAAHEHRKMASEHAYKADGIDRQLDASIYSDDPDAVEALEAKAARLEAEADRCKAINKAARLGGPGWVERIDPPLTDEERAEIISNAKYSTGVSARQPFPAYHLALLRANARRCRERIKAVRRQQESQAEAEAAPGGIVYQESESGWCSVRFAEYPGRPIVSALKAAFFSYSGGSWSGPVSRLPELVRQEIEAASALSAQRPA